MNSAGNNKKTGYLVVALLLVGLIAYSNAVKELTDIRQLTLGATRFVAQLSNAAEVPSVPDIPPVPEIAAKVETCKSRHAAMATAVEPQPEIGNSERRVRVKPIADRPTGDQIAKLKKVQRFEINSADFEVRMSADQFPVPTEPIAIELPLSAFKAKVRKCNLFKFNPRDREMLLKTLNRSNNLRITG